MASAGRKGYGEEPVAGTITNWQDDIKKLKKENMTYQETINRIVDHIMTQPMKIPCLEQTCSSGSSNKIKNAMEIVSILTQHLQSKEKDLKEISRENKKLESRLEISEKEKNICKQQINLLNPNSSNQSSQQNSANNSYLTSGVSNFLSKSPKNLVSVTAVAAQNQSHLGMERANLPQAQNSQNQQRKPSHSPIFNAK